jgi:hypothetical protein
MTKKELQKELKRREREELRQVLYVSPHFCWEALQHIGRFTLVVGVRPVV